MAVKVRGLLAGDPAVFDLSESKIGDSGSEALGRALVTVNAPLTSSVLLGPLGHSVRSLSYNDSNVHVANRFFQPRAV